MIFGPQASPLLHSHWRCLGRLDSQASTPLAGAALNALDAAGAVRHWYPLLLSFVRCSHGTFDVENLASDRAGSHRPLGRLTASSSSCRHAGAPSSQVSPGMGLGPEPIADIRASYGADLPLTHSTPRHHFLSGNLALRQRVPVATCSSPACRRPALPRSACVSAFLAVLLATLLALLPGRGCVLRSFPAPVRLDPVFWLGILLIRFLVPLKLIPHQSGEVQGSSSLADPRHPDFPPLAQVSCQHR